MKATTKAGPSGRFSCFSPAVRPNGQGGGPAGAGLFVRNQQRELRVSDLAVRILFPNDTQDQSAALREAANSPNLFREINEKWPDNLPGDANLRAYLIRRGFNQKSVDQAIVIFRGAVSLAEDEAGEHDLQEEHGPEVAPGPPAKEKGMHVQRVPAKPQAPAKPIVFDMETISGQYCFDNADDLAGFIEKLERIRPLLPPKESDGSELV